MEKILKLLLEAGSGVKEYIESPGIKPAFEIANIVKNSHYFDVCYEENLERPEFARFIEERDIRGFPDLSELERLLPGTLGYEYAKFLRTNNIDPSAIPMPQISDGKSFFLARGRETHDIYHVVLGVPPTMPGELAIQGFQVAQNAMPISKILVSLAFIRTLEYRDTMYEFLDPLTRGYLVGRQARLFIVQKWEDAWDKPLAEWRRELGVTPIMSS
ncbi:Coq4 family protein [Sorangium sp. So ce429]